MDFFIKREQKEINCSKENGPREKVKTEMMKYFPSLHTAQTYMNNYTQASTVLISHIWMTQRLDKS